MLNLTQSGTATGTATGMATGPATLPAKSTPTPVKPPAVLVVEDDPSVFMLILKLLRHYGFTVIHASTGLEGLVMAQNLCPDIVVLDVELPGMSGLEICRQLKSDPKTRPLPVVFCSGQGFLAGEAFDLGAAAFLVKPLDVVHLPACLGKILFDRQQDTLNPGGII